ncbi:response regulator transcription factor [Bacteroidota bacterium]
MLCSNAFSRYFAYLFVESMGERIDILLLEDDAVLAREIVHYFTSETFACDVVYDGNLFFRQWKKKEYAIFLLDVNVPGMNGFDVSTKIRETDSLTPILFLTAFGELEDKRTGYKSGADDYLVKPFHLEELELRIESLLKRRSHPRELEEIIHIADLQIDVGLKTVIRAGRSIELSPKEFQLLLLLAKAKGRVLSKEFIASEIWDMNMDNNFNTIQVYINFLRRKMDKDFDVKLIHNRVGFGYYLKPESE